MLKSFGRLVGRTLLARYPDESEMIARRISRHLEPGEVVLAAVFVQVPGTNSAMVQGGASAGLDGGSVSSDDGRGALWKRQAEEVGIDPDLAKRTIKAIVAVTDSRLLVVRRAYTTGRTLELLAGWPVEEVDEVTVPRGAISLRIFRGGAELTFELPNDHRFIGQVYRDLPDILTQVQASSRTEPDH